MPRRKSQLSRQSITAKRLRLIRRNETEDEKMNRLMSQRLITEQNRLRESSAERSHRLAKQRARISAKRARKSSTERSLLLFQQCNSLNLDFAYVSCSSCEVSEKPRKKRSTKEKDSNKPKRPSTAFMLWLNETRETIKKEHPGIKVTEIAKKGGEMWRDMKDKSEWEAKASKAKDEYTQAMKEYEAAGGSKSSGGGGDENKKKKTEKKKPTSSPVKSDGQYKSKEYISDSDSESSGDDKKKGDSKKAEASKKESSAEEMETSGSEKEADSD